VFIIADAASMSVEDVRMLTGFRCTPLRPVRFMAVSKPS